MWVMLMLDTLVAGIRRLLWQATWPFRRFTADHHDRVADGFLEQAAQAGRLGKRTAAVRLRAVAYARRREAARLRAGNPS